MVNRRKIPLPIEAAKKWLESRNLRTDDITVSRLATEFLYYFKLGADNQ